LSGEGKLTFKLSEVLAFGVSFTGFYDNNPPVPIEKLYYTLTNQLKLTF
jgi:hypothetical protein